MKNIPALALALTIVGVCGALVIAFEWSSFGCRRTQLSTRDRDARIVARIVEVNPRAALKDFDAEFPAFLVAQATLAGLDYRLVMAVIEKESGWRSDAVGSAGEIGLMQVLPATASLVAYEAGVAYEPPVRARVGYASLGTLGDPRGGVAIGMAYLTRQVRMYGPTPTALRGYNRAPDKAREARPLDRYAEDVALTFVTISHRVPAGL